MHRVWAAGRAGPDRPRATEARVREQLGIASCYLRLAGNLKQLIGSGDQQKYFFPAVDEASRQIISISGPRFAGPRSMGEQLVPLFGRRRTPITAPGVPTPREPAPSGTGHKTFTPTVSGPTAAADEPEVHKPAAPNPEVGPAGRWETGDALTAADVMYMLVPSGSGADCTAANVDGASAASVEAEGWMLLALHGHRRHWSMPLLGRGAALTAPPRVAQAVAVRVLTDLGVHVQAWHRASGADQPIYRAGLERPAPPPAPVGRRRDGVSPFSLPHGEPGDHGVARWPAVSDLCRRAGPDIKPRT
jgi:hypothetical protein